MISLEFVQNQFLLGSVLDWAFVATESKGILDLWLVVRVALRGARRSNGGSLIISKWNGLTSALVVDWLGELS
jgi:hypothetical protein